MSNSETPIQNTQHAFLVAWGWFAEHLGLIQKFQALSLKQKHYQHRPQTKVLEFLVAILAGLQHLQDISRAAHPLDKDQAVAQAWEQPAWADYSGVSRTLSGLSWKEVKQIVQVLEQISQPYIDTEVQVLRSQGKRLRLDGDLTGIPVSNTSRTYPHAAFGHMDDDIRLGYQAGVVSLESPTYGRLWLSVAHHPGDTVSCTQAEALVVAAEASLKRRPRRRTELLRQRIHAFEQQVAQTGERWETQKQAVKQAKERMAEAEQQVQERKQQVDDLEKEYQTRKLQERPTSRLAQAGDWSDVLAAGESGMPLPAHPPAAGLPAPAAPPLPAAPWPASRLASAFPIARLCGPPAARTLAGAGAAAQCAVEV